MKATSRAEPDAIVIGAGFGGLGAALGLAERGRRVLLLEALGYPGGCASTFSRGGVRFEAGATLFSGLGEGGLFRRWIDTHALEVEVEWLDPVLEFRSPTLSIDVTADRERLVGELCALPGAPARELRRFFAYQRRAADGLWSLFDAPSLLPPFRLPDLPRLVARAPRLLPALRFLGRPLERALRHYGVADFAPLRTWVDALCQITVQCSSREAEAAAALAAMDYFWRGTGHVRGGIGTLASELTRALTLLGSEVRLAERVTGLTRRADRWRVTTRRGTHEAPLVIANLQPAALEAVLSPEVRRGPSLARISAGVEQGWGACASYLVLRGTDAPPRHLQLISDAAAPLIAGNHVFCSVSGAADGPRAPAGAAPATLSPHVSIHELKALSPDQHHGHFERIQARMRRTLELRAPELAELVLSSLPASPRTFERFTGRPGGYVGGVPRLAAHGPGLRPARGQVAPGLHLVGDSLFPGQSVLATALGGQRLAGALS